MWSLIDVSCNLHTTIVKLTGLQWSNVFIDPFLNSGVLFAYFHSERTIPSSSDQLNPFANDILFFFTIPLSSFGRNHQLQVIYYLSSY